jgi:hypothetical protein
MKFLTTESSAPSWILNFEFSQDVSHCRNQTFLCVSPKVAVSHGNQPFIFFDLYGLRYKHFQNFKIEVLKGSCTQQETYIPAGNLIGKEMHKEIIFSPTSKEGTISLTDGFETYALNWTLTSDQIYVAAADNRSQVIIHFEQGVIDIPNQQFNQMMIDLYTECKARATDSENIAMFNRQIAKLTQQNSIQ